MSRATARSLSGDSHDDFAPKKKDVPEGMEEVQALIKEQVESNDVMLYMKGTPSAPQCGFSMQTVRILNAVGVDYASVNVLDHAAIRDGIKVYGDWPTIPQLYVKGEFVGGCDIVTTMFTEGEFDVFLKDQGIKLDE